MQAHDEDEEDEQLPWAEAVVPKQGKKEQGEGCELQMWSGECLDDRRGPVANYGAEGIWGRHSVVMQTRKHLGHGPSCQSVSPSLV